MHELLGVTCPSNSLITWQGSQQNIFLFPALLSQKKHSLHVDWTGTGGMQGCGGMEYLLRSWGNEGGMGAWILGTMSKLQDHFQMCFF